MTKQELKKILIEHKEYENFVDAVKKHQADGKIFLRFVIYGKEENFEIGFDCVENKIIAAKAFSMKTRKSRKL